MLKHGAHFHITFGKGKDIYENGFMVGTESMIKLEKSKLSPKFVDIPCYIDARAGGRIDEVDSFVRYLVRGGIDIIKASSWYSVKDTIESMVEQYPVLKDKKDLLDLRKNVRKNDMYEEIHSNTDFYYLLQVRLIDFINNIYPQQRRVNGDFQNEIISKCRWFREPDDINLDSENADKLIIDKLKDSGIIRDSEEEIN